LPPPTGLVGRVVIIVRDPRVGQSQDIADQGGSE
jgi:hypothetical protein